MRQIEIIYILLKHFNYNLTLCIMVQDTYIVTLQYTHKIQQYQGKKLVKKIQPARFQISLMLYKTLQYD